jgi:hypothetical protein
MKHDAAGFSDGKELREARSTIASYARMTLAIAVPFALA